MGNVCLFWRVRSFIQFLDIYLNRGMKNIRDQMGYLDYFLRFKRKLASIIKLNSYGVKVY